MLLADWMARIYDIKDTFLKGKFEDGEEIFMKNPQGIEHHYWDSMVLSYLSLYMGRYRLHYCFGESC